MVKAIIFDCFGVLYQGSLEHLMDRCPSENKSQLKDLSIASDYGYVSRQEYHQTAAALLGMAEAEIESIIALSHVRNVALIDDVRRRRLTHKIALLSNIGQDVMNTLFTSQEFDELFDVVVLSSDVGMVKPNPEIYEYTASKLGVQPSECVMVDDLAMNVDGATSTGMQGVRYVSFKQYARDIDKMFDN
ncbi:HAD family hydrolase [bacterium]|nr:MAG: HAD family hydrolase [bacterium]